ncbi:helix-turn-helix domain-containing protein [Gloeocapsopsis dulcis]|nr:transposase family protein [Gloeocapsopsis dulcis]
MQVKAWHKEGSKGGTAMSEADLQHLSDSKFKRLCGVSRDTFAQMVEVLRPHLEREGQRGGQNKLRTQDQLLVTLEYWREYRSQFHIGTSWGVHEIAVGQIIKKVEDLLVKCGKFRHRVNAPCINLDGSGKSW